MASDLSKAQFRGLLIPDPRLTTIWSAQSSFTQADPQPGVPEAQGDYDLALTSSGVQAASTDYIIRTSEPGHPSKTGPASFMWKNQGDASTAYRGWDVPNVVTSFQQITYTNFSTTGDSQRSPSAVTLDDQTVICAYYYKDSSISHSIRVRTMAAGASVFGSEVVVYTQSNDPSDAIDADFNVHFMKLPDDRVLLYYLAETASGLGNIRAYESTDKGATWSIAASAVLDEPISISAAAASSGDTTFKMQRIRAAYGGGQVLLLVGVVSNNSDYTNRQLWKQYASDSAGLHFTKVEDAPTTTSSWSSVSGAAYELSLFDVAYQAGSFVVSSVQSMSAKTVTLSKLGSAFQALTTAQSASTSELSIDLAPINATTKAFTGDAFGNCMAISDNGQIYMYSSGMGTISPTTSCFGVCFVSRDDADSIEFLGKSGIIAEDSTYSSPQGVWWTSGDTQNVGPNRYVATFARGRVIIFGESEPGTAAGTGYNRCVSMLCLGGSSTVTMPGIEGYTDETKRGGWEQNWVPYYLPGDTGYWTKSENATVVENLNTSGFLSISTASAAGYIRYSANPGSSVFDDGLLVRFSLTCTAGTLAQLNVGTRIRLAQNSPNNDYDVTIAFSSSAFRVYDNNASAQIGSDVSIDMTTEREFIIAMKGGSDGNNDGVYQAWYRTKNSASDREWTKSIGSTTLSNDTSASAATNNEVLWGNISAPASSAVTNSKWSEFHVSMGQSVGENITTQVNPADLWAKGYSTVGGRSYVNGGTFVTAHGGPARRDDLFLLSTRYGYPINRVMFSESQTPRVKWRSTDLTQQTIALALDNTILGTDDSFPGNDVIGICLLGINWQTGELQGYNVGTTSWDTIAEIDSASGMSALPWTREGGSVMPKAVSSESQYLHTAEFAGGTFGLKDGTGTNLRKIVTNTSGKWSGSTTQKLPTIILEGVAASDRSSGNSGYIMSPNVTVIAKLNGSKYAGYRLMIDAQSTVDGYFEIGNVIIGWVEAFGRQYSRGRVLETQANTSVVARTDGTTTSKNYGPSQRTVQLAWTDGVEVSSVQGSAPDPDYILGSTDGNAEPIASAGDVPYQVEGIVRMMNGPDKAVVYLPSVDKAGNTVTLNRRHQFVAGRLTSPARLESVVGDENLNPGEVFRVASVNIEEIV